MTLEHTLKLLADGLSQTVIGLIREMTIEELLALSAREGAPTPKPKAPTGTRTPKPAAVLPHPVIVPTAETPVAETPIPKAPPLSRFSQKPSYLNFRHEAQKRLANAIVDFVKNHPGADAKLVSMRLGVPVGRAHDTLDDLVISGKMTMASGHHGRVYRVVG